MLRHTPSEFQMINPWLSKTDKKKKNKCSFLNLEAKTVPFFERKIKNWLNNYASYFKEMKKITYFEDSL